MFLKSSPTALNKCPWMEGIQIPLTETENPFAGYFPISVNRRMDGPASAHYRDLGSSYFEPNVLHFSLVPLRMALTVLSRS